MRTRKWTDKEGVVRYTTEIIGSEMQMLGRAPRDQDTSEAEDRGEPERPAKRESKPAPHGGRGDGGLSDMPDDVPFLPRGFGGQWRVE